VLIVEWKVVKRTPVYLSLEEIDLTSAAITYAPCPIAVRILSLLTEARKRLEDETKADTNLRESMTDEELQYIRDRRAQGDS
jgi:hypothetical protein